MNISDWFGLLTVALSLGCVCGILFQKLSRTCQLMVAGIITLFSLIPLPFDTGACTAMYIYSVTGMLSIPLLIAVFCNIVGIRQSNHRKGIVMTILLTGLILYLGEIGILPFDLFQYGYDPIVALIIAIIGMILTDVIGSVILLAGYCLFSIGIYDNFFIALVDPILWGIAIVSLIQQVGKKRNLEA